MTQGGELREMEWAPPTETAPLFFAWEDTPEEYGPWQWTGESGRAAGRFTADAFTLQENGTLRCPAGASLWLSEVRQENAFTQRAVYLAYQTDCQRCSLREQCLASRAKGDRARRAGWMWQVEHFVAPGPPIGVDNMSRCLNWLKPPRTLHLHPALLALYVRIIVGVGMIGWYVMLGRDLHNGASLWLAFRLFSP
jgi:Transposase DDE domain